MVGNIYLGRYSFSLTWIRRVNMTIKESKENTLIQHEEMQFLRTSTQTRPPFRTTSFALFDLAASRHLALLNPRVNVKRNMATYTLKNARDLVFQWICRKVH